MNSFMLFFSSAQYFDYGLYLVCASLSAHVYTQHPDVPPDSDIAVLSTRQTCSVCEYSCRMVESAIRLMELGAEVQQEMHDHPDNTSLEQTALSPSAEADEEPKTPLPVWLNDLSFDL